MNFDEFRSQYPVFYYHSYTISEEDGELRIKFDFEIKGNEHFEPTFRLPLPAGRKGIKDSRLLRTAAFSLGMVELVSYWKQTCSPEVIVECGCLDDVQNRWWKKLYYNGLGEFFYVNGIDADPDTFMELKSTGEAIEGCDYPMDFCGNLIPVGGGKDSFVSLDLLKDHKKENTAFIINHIKSAMASADAAGYHEGEDLVIASRSLDSRMLENNKKGFLNGHTPFSALAAFAAVVTAIVYHKKYICLSNEDSANESTVKGSKVNHQYSKTFEFEQDFKFYMDTYITDRIHYFSLLRPISELQIAGIFSRLTPYLTVFRSCNVGQKEGVWCGKCAKCLFVCIILSAYLPDETLLQIFGRDMLNDGEMEDLFAQLTGMTDNKPFECVGTREEVNVAIAMAIAAHEAEGRELPYLYKQYAASSYYAFYTGRKVDYLNWNNANLLPEEYAVILHERLEELAHE